VIFCPEEQGKTRPFAHFSTRKGALPAWFKRAALIALHHRVLRQDREILAIQKQAIERLGKADFAIGPLDLLGPAIWRLANGEVQPEQTYRVTVAL